MRHPFRLLVALLLVALAGGALVAAPAQAAVSAQVSGTVVDADGAPVRGITVLGFPDGDYDDVIYLHTNSRGEYATRHGDRFTAGTRTLSFWDESGEYVNEDVEVTLRAGANVVPPVTMGLGGRATGTVTAVSGAPVKDLTVYAAGVDEPQDEDDPVGDGYDQTDREGRFELGPLAAGQYEVYHQFSPEDEDAAVGFTVAAGETYAESLGITGVRVTPRISVTASSPSKRKATVKVSVSAASYGLSVRGGTFDLYDGSRKVKSKVSVQDGTRVLSVTKLAKGRHRFWARFLGSTDVVEKSSRQTAVTVK